MPITFESIRDPYGIASAGSILGQALMQRGLEKRAEQSQIGSEKRAEQRNIAKEQRARELQKQYGQILGPALGIAQDYSLTPAERMAGLQKYVTETGDTSVLPMIKQIGEEAKRDQLMQMLGLSPVKYPQEQMQAQTLPISQRNLQPQGPITQLQQIPAQQPVGLAGLSDQQLVAASVMPELKIPIDAEFKRREAEKKQFESERKYHATYTKDIEKEMDDLRTSIPRSEAALNLANQAITSGNLGFFSPDKLADVTGIEAFRTAKGAQLITASKEFLISNLSRISARAQNQWLEQRFNSMFPHIGQSKEANESAEVVIRQEDEIKKTILKNYDKLVEQDIKQFGYLKRDILKRAHAQAEPEMKEVLNKTSYKLKDIQESEKGLKGMRKSVLEKVPKGTPLTENMMRIFLEKYQSPDKAIENAKKLGYTIYSPSQVEAYK